MIDEWSAIGERGPSPGVTSAYQSTISLQIQGLQKIGAFFVRSSGAAPTLYFAAWSGPMGTSASSKIRPFQRANREAAPRMGGLAIGGVSDRRRTVHNYSCKVTPRWTSLLAALDGLAASSNRRQGRRLSLALFAVTLSLNDPSKSTRSNREVLDERIRRYFRDFLRGGSRAPARSSSRLRLHARGGA